MKPSRNSSTPVSRHSEARPRSKSASRLLQSSDEFGENLPPNLSLSQSKKGPLRIRLSPQASIPLSPQEPLHLSPSPLRRSKARLINVGEVPVDQVGGRKKCRRKDVSVGLMGCASPKNGKRARWRMDHENREERDLGLGEENGKARKKRQNRRVVKQRERLSSAPSVPSPGMSPTTESANQDWSGLDCIYQMISELIMWKDVAKSSLWFGFGSLCFLSSCFSTGFRFSIISVTSQLGLLFLGVAFFYNSFLRRHKDDQTPEFQLGEDDILRAAQLILPAANAAIEVTRRLFSGKPSMTLKMAPIFLFAAEFGHLITLWRLFALVEHLRNCMSDAWEACSHKRLVAASAATAFWNLSSLRVRIFAAFISVVVLRYYQQQTQAEVGGEEEEKQQLALVARTQEGSHED